MPTTHMLEIDVAGVENNWATFPSASWINTLGSPISIFEIQGNFAGAQSLIGEIGAWLLIPGRTSGDVQTVGNYTGEIIFPFGEESYVAPFQEVPSAVPLPTPIVIQPNEQLVLVTNAGPVNLPTGGQSAPFNYVAVVRVWYTV